MATVRWERERAIGVVDPAQSDDLDGHMLAIDGITAADDEHLGWLGRAPCVVVAMTPEGAQPSSVVDVVIEESEPEVLDQLAARVAANPQASRTLVEVLRAGPSMAVSSGLILESLAYSTLLAGLEFGRWLSSRDVSRAREVVGPPVLVERSEGGLNLTLNRPENRNALSAEMRDALVDALALAVVDDDITRVHIAGAGPSFCSGGDLTEFGTSLDVVRAHQIRTQRSIGAVLHELRSKVVVHVHGACVGAGIELPAFARRVVADPDATFRLPEVGMGLIPGAGGTVSIARRIGRQSTARFALLGDERDVGWAIASGLVDEVAEPR